MARSQELSEDRKNPVATKGPNKIACLTILTKIIVVKELTGKIKREHHENNSQEI